MRTILLAVFCLLAWLVPLFSAPVVRCFVYDSNKKLVAVYASPVVAKPGQFVVIVDAEAKPTTAQIDTAYASMLAVKAAAEAKPEVKTDTRLDNIEARLQAVEGKVGILPK